MSILWFDVRNQQKLVYISKSDYLCVDFVMMPSGAVERQRRYIARIAADPQKRADFLMKDRERKKQESCVGTK